MFLATAHLYASGVKTLYECFEQYRYDVLLGDAARLKIELKTCDTSK
jgi:hypothetical protein